MTLRIVPSLIAARVRLVLSATVATPARPVRAELICEWQAWTVPKLGSSEQLLSKTRYVGGGAMFSPAVTVADNLGQNV